VANRSDTCYDHDESVIGEDALARDRHLIKPGRSSFCYLLSIVYYRWFQMQGNAHIMITRRSVMALGLIGLSLTLSHAADDAVKALEGKWATDGSAGISAEWTFKGDKLEADVNGNLYKADFKLDPAAKPHASMDLEITDSPDGNGTKRSGKAIYKVDGDKLQICVSLPGQDRPSEFANIDEVQYKFELKKKK
jgi:uncharacterized protein (TIGR03067 family)